MVQGERRKGVLGVIGGERLKKIMPSEEKRFELMEGRKNI